MQKILDVSIFPACAYIACDDGVAGGKIFNAYSICFGPSRFKSAKKQLPDYNRRNEYLFSFGNMLFDKWVIRKESDYDIGIKQVFTTH